MKPPQDPADWTRVRAEFERLDALEPAAAAAELGALESVDRELAGRLRTMLEAAGDGSLSPLVPRAPDVGSDLVGRTIGGFEILRRVGYGGMGVVYEAQQLEPRRRVAFKTLRFAAGGARGQERVVREAQLLGSLSHAAVARVYASGMLAGPEDEGTGAPWFAMEYVAEARSILDFAAERGLDARRRLELLLQAARGVEHVHARGIVHRDLKSSNVLVDAEGAVKVIDFGVARGGDEPALTRTGDVLGSLGSMAPEQASGAGAEIDARADVYALGCLLYELLCGVPPVRLEGLDLLEAAERLRREPVRRPIEAEAALGPDARWVLARALEKRPADRYTDAGELARELERLLERLPVQAGPPTTVYRIKSFVRRNRGFVAVSGVVLGSLLLGTLGTAWGLLRARESAQVARDDRDTVFQLVAGRSLQQLDDEQRRLWPPLPGMLPELESWNARAEALLGRLPQLRAAAAQVARQRGGDLDAFDPVLAARPLDWLSEELGRVIAGLERLGDAELGPKEAALGAPFGWGVARRVAVARDLAAREDDPAVAAVWGEVDRRLGLDPRFADVALEHMVDLAPLGPDPASGLEEFAVLTTGRPPERDGAGRLEVDGETAIVLVLIPPGEWWTGMQFEHPEQECYVEQYMLHSGGPRQREVAALLISKYELSRGQWARMGTLAAEVARLPDGHRTREEMPLEACSYTESTLQLRRFGMRLPTILEWEVAARGGRESRWWWGEDPGEAWRYANLADASLHRAGWRDRGETVGALHDDGFATLAPIDALLPNPFGLHHVIGNVEEWVNLRQVLIGSEHDEQPTILDQPARASGGYVTRVEETASAGMAPVTESVSRTGGGLRPMRDLPRRD